jgi:hypothetical protein
MAQKAKGLWVIMAAGLRKPSQESMLERKAGFWARVNPLAV